MVILLQIASAIVILVLMAVLVVIVMFDMIAMEIVIVHRHGGLCVTGRQGLRQPVGGGELVLGLAWWQAEA